MGDVDGDGRLEVIIGDLNGYIYCLNGEDGSLLWRIHTHTGIWWCSPVLGDVDDDKQLEVIAGDYYGYVYCLNGENGSLLWMYKKEGDCESHFALGDVDGDGHLEVIIGTGGDDGNVYWYVDFLAAFV